MIIIVSWYYDGGEPPEVKTFNPRDLDQVVEAINHTAEEGRAGKLVKVYQAKVDTPSPAVVE